MLLAFFQTHKTSYSSRSAAPVGSAPAIFLEKKKKKKKKTVAVNPDSVELEAPREPGC